tara:strand:+ start:25 stop:150 length:126 start_codon:yes stop_codon:yes gene_type:complete
MVKKTKASPKVTKSKVPDFEEIKTNWIPAAVKFEQTVIPRK